MARGLRRTDHPSRGEETSSSSSPSRTSARPSGRSSGSAGSSPASRSRSGPGTAPATRASAIWRRRRMAASAATRAASSCGAASPSRVREFANCDEVFRQITVWTYRTVSSSGSMQGEVSFLFYRPSLGAPLRLWYPGVPESDLLLPASCATTVAERLRDGVEPGRGDAVAPRSPPRGPARRPAQVAQVVQIVEEPPAAAAAIAAVSSPRRSTSKDLGKLAERFASVGDPAAKPLTVESPEGSAHAPTSPSATVTEGHAEPHRSGGCDPPRGRARRPGSPTGSPTSAPAPSRRKLSKKEIRALTEALDQKYKSFLNLVEIIITDDEREVFLQIQRELPEGQVHRVLLEAALDRQPGHAYGLSRRSTRGASSRRSSSSTTSTTTGPGCSSSTGRRTRSSRSSARTSTCRCRSGTTSGSRSSRARCT